MNTSANHSVFHFYMTQLALALSCLLALSTNVMGFQDDDNEAPKTEQKEDSEKSDDDEPDFLKIGADAPALDIKYWPTDNNGLLPPVKKFESGKVYVLNFFQVEQEYSVSNLPRIAKLQEKYTDDPVQIVCISTSDREKTDEFLDGKFKSDEKSEDSDAETYFDLLSSVSSAVDNDDRSATRNYMAKSGMLTAWTFVIGKTGKLEWMGTPTDVAEPLAKVVKGKWDRKAFAKEVDSEQTQRFRRAQSNKLFAEWMAEMSKGKRFTNAEELLEQLAEGAKDPANKKFRVRIEGTRMSFMLRALEQEADLENLEADLTEVMRSFTELSDNDLNSELNDSSWKVYEIYEAGLIEKDSELMKVAKVMAEKAYKFRPKSGAVNDTIAHFVYLIDGDLERAIKLQEFAVKNSGDAVEELESFLKFLKKEQATGKKKSLQKQSKEGESDF